MRYPGVRYRINDRDEITFVDSAWDQFALSNDGADMIGDRVIGRSLWDFITDDSTRHIYRQILNGVRHERPALFTLRCDGTVQRRVLEMTIGTPEPGVIEFETHFLRIEERPFVSLLAKDAPRSKGVLIACAWCNRVDVAGDWVELEVAIERLKLFEVRDLPHLSHGICGDCFTRMTGMDNVLLPRLNL